MKRLSKILKKTINQFGILSIISISSFLFFNSKISASEPLYVKLDLTHTNYLNTYNNLKDDLDLVINTIENNNVYNYKYILYIGNEPTYGDFIRVYLFNHDYDTTDTCYLLPLRYYGSSNLYRLDGGCSNSNRYTHYTYYSDYDGYQIDDINSLISNINNTLNTENYTNTSGRQKITIQSVVSYYFEAFTYSFFTGNTNFVYPYTSSGVDVNVKNINSTANELYNLRINDINYPINSAITSEELNTINGVNILPTINFTSTSNTIIVDDIEYINSKDVTINFNASDYENYFYIYKLENSNNWITYNPIQAETNITLNVSENTHVIAQILDKNTSEIVTTSTYTISDINKYTGLTLRKTYNSGTNGNDLHSLNIINYDSTYDIDFKIQFGPNDFDGSHTPYITQINAYAYNTQTQQKINTSAVYVDDFICYKEIEGDVETWCTGTLKTDMNSPSYYEIIFANTDNYYLYYYDNYVLDDRKIDITTNLFKDYNKYYFNMNSDKAYINLKSINQSNKEGSIIIPYYYLNNDELDIKVRKYNSSIGDFETNYNSYPFIDNYYHKIDFEISDTYYPIITNKKGRYCTTYYVNDQEILEEFKTSENLFYPSYTLGDLYYSIFLTDISSAIHLYDTQTECYQEEEVYFYVHKDFKVTFGEIGSSDDVYIYDDNFNVIDKVDKDFNNTSPYTGSETFFDSVKNSINYFATPIREILNMISYLWSGLNPIIQCFIIFIFIFLIGLFVFKFLL